MFRNLIIAPLLPITVLILATGALGNEIEDRTLPYLTLKPIGRLRIVVEKLIGVFVVAYPLVCAGMIATYLLAFRGEAGDEMKVLWAMLAATAVAVAGYGAIFLLISLLISRALLAGIMYALLWESLLGRYLPGTAGRQRSPFQRIGLRQDGRRSDRHPSKRDQHRRGRVHNRRRRRRGSRVFDDSTAPDESRLTSSDNVLLAVESETNGRF